MRVMLIQLRLVRGARGGDPPGVDACRDCGYLISDTSIASSPLPFQPRFECRVASIRSVLRCRP
jgi:hypothetical protein